MRTLVCWKFEFNASVETGADKGARAKRGIYSISGFSETIKIEKGEGNMPNIDMKILNYKKVMYREYSTVIAKYSLTWLKINFERKFPGRFPL